MKQTKYIMSGGLAFAEEKDMKKLRRFSLKGWHVTGFKFSGYTLEKGESSDYIYSVDYRSLEVGEEDEYFDVFASAGWSHVTSEGDIHLFRAEPGTKAIYSDSETLVEKYKSLSNSMGYIAISLVVLTALAWLGTIMSSGVLHSLLTVIGIVLTVVAFPATLTAIASYNNKWKVEEKKGSVALLKIIPAALVIMAVLVLVFGDYDSARLLAYMIIGGTVFPAVIWLIMSLFHKVRNEG
ncbi:hypothetical protein CHN50_03445 [Priestia aryabhattai]|uniref:DUF2812 domain-containing protein n=1 Tax=Priestia sp. GS2 TaxID=3117403 RepID=UPI000BA11779|nr:hypothetical protein CHN50_03445 [Priestia aryabhattai]